MQISLLLQFDPSLWNLGKRSGRGWSQAEGELRGRGRRRDRGGRGSEQTLTLLELRVGRWGVFAAAGERGCLPLEAGAGCQVFF